MYSFVRLNYRCTSPVSTLCNGLNLTWVIARRHVSYWEKHQYRFLLCWGFHWDRFWAHYFFHLHQWFATFYTKFWNWYVCRWHYHLVISDHVWKYMYTTVITRKSWQCKLLVQPWQDEAGCQKQTKQMLIRTAQKLCCVDKTCMSLFLYLTWNLHIDYVISKVN